MIKIKWGVEDVVPYNVKYYACVGADSISARLIYTTQKSSAVEAELFLLFMIVRTLDYVECAVDGFKQNYAHKLMREGQL